MKYFVEGNPPLSPEAVKKYDIPLFDSPPSRGRERDGAKRELGRF
jgi:hypothetical protein